MPLHSSTVWFELRSTQHLSYELASYFITAMRTVCTRICHGRLPEFRVSRTQMVQDLALTSMTGADEQVIFGSSVPGAHLFG